MAAQVSSTGPRPSAPVLPAGAGRVVVMGVLNVTPDSFSDGGRWVRTDDAVAHGLQLVRNGADLVDVGGESTRPGAQRIPAEEEQRRVLPVIERLAASGVPVSVDTMNASTAAAAVQAGAGWVNDVSGGLADPSMLATVADLPAVFIASHWRGFSDTMQQRADYSDVVGDVRAALEQRVGALQAAGVAAERIVLDPGLGFGKRPEHNWRLLAGLRELASLGHPVLVGASRKRFLGDLLPDGAEPDARDELTAVVTALAVRDGAWGVRVHDVTRSRRAADAALAWIGGAA